MIDKLTSYINSNILKAEFEVEVAIEEILNDLVKDVPDIKIKGIKFIREFDEQGEYFKVKILTRKK